MKKFLRILSAVIVAIVLAGLVYWLTQKTDTSDQSMTGVDLSGCISYFDGCNNCMVVSGTVTACTKMYCKTPETPRCLEYATGAITGVVSGAVDQAALDRSNIELITLYFANLQNRKYQEAFELLTGSKQSASDLAKTYDKVTKIGTRDFQPAGSNLYKGKVDIEETLSNTSYKKYEYQVVKEVIDGKIRNVSTAKLSETTINPEAPAVSGARREGKIEKNLPDLIISDVKVTESAIIEDGGQKMRRPSLQVTVKNIGKGAFIPQVQGGSSSQNKLYTTFSVQCKTPVDVKNYPDRYGYGNFSFYLGDTYNIDRFPMKTNDTLDIYSTVSRSVPHVDPDGTQYPNIPFGRNTPGPKDIICVVNPYYFNKEKDLYKESIVKEADYTNNFYEFTLDLKEAK